MKKAVMFFLMFFLILGAFLSALFPHPCFAGLDEAVEDIARDDPQQAARFYAQAANYYRIKGEQKKALSVLEGAPPDIRFVPEALSILTDLYLSTDQAGKAEVLLLEALRREPANREAVMRLVALYESRQKPEQALKVLENALGTFPEDWEIPQRLSILYQASGQTDRGIELFKALQRDHPDRIDLIQQLDHFYRIRGDGEAADALWDTFSSSHPENTEALLRKAEILLEKENAVEAVTILEQASDSSPGDPRIGLALARAYEASDRLEDAEKLLKRLIVAPERDHPIDRSEIWMVTKNFYGRMEKEEAFFAMLEKQAASSEDLSILLETADFLLWESRPEHAESLLQKALRSHPDNPELKSLFVRLYLETGRLKEAEKLLQKEHSENPYDPGIALSLADLYLRMEKPEKAVSVMKEVSEKHVGDELIQAACARILVKSGRDGEAIEVIRKTIRTNEVDPLLIDEPVGAYIHAGRFAEAMDFLRKLGSSVRNFPAWRQAIDRRLEEIGQMQIQQAQMERTPDADPAAQPSGSLLPEDEAPAGEVPPPPAPEEKRRRRRR